MYLDCGQTFVRKDAITGFRVPVILLVFIVKMSLSSPYDDFVVHISDVHDKLHIEVEVVSQDAADDVGGDIVASMTQMCVVIDCRTAGIP